MRFLIVNTPRTTPPPDMLPSMLERAEAWQERYNDKFEVFGMFPGGGGFAVADVQDEAELHRMVAEMPFSPFGDLQIRVFVDGETGWRQAKEAVAAMMASR